MKFLIPDRSNVSPLGISPEFEGRRYTSKGSNNLPSLCLKITLYNDVIYFY